LVRMGWMEEAFVKEGAGLGRHMARLGVQAAELC